MVAPKIALMALIVYTGYSMLWGQVKTDTPKKELTATLIVDKTTVSAGEPMLATVIIKNDTEQTFNLDVNMFGSDIKSNHTYSKNCFEISKGTGGFSMYGSDMPGLEGYFAMMYHHVEHTGKPLGAGQELVIQELFTCQGSSGHPFKDVGKYHLRYHLNYRNTVTKEAKHLRSNEVEIEVQNPKDNDKDPSTIFLDKERVYLTRPINPAGWLLYTEAVKRRGAQEAIEELKDLVKKYPKSIYTKYLKYLLARQYDTDFRYQERNLQYVSRNVSKDALEVLWDIVKNEKEFCLTIQCWKDLLMLYQQTGDTKKCEEIRKHLQEKYKDHPSLKAQHAYWMLGQLPGIPEPETPIIEGNVVSYDSDRKIVTLDIGEEHGVKVGMSYTIYRTGTPGTFVGRVKIESVERTKSTGKIEIESLQPMAGDKCANRLKVK